MAADLPASGGGSEGPGPPEAGLPPGLLRAYEPLAELGRGAVGRVLKARQRALDRRVVLKLVDFSASASPSSRERFLAEARLLAGMNHRHVLAVLDHGLEAGLAWVVYPDEGGASLDRWMRVAHPGGRVPVEDAVAILDQTLQGLEHVHARGVVHRDLKPPNLLVAADGTVRVFDFGLARDLAALGQLTDTSTIVGTPTHMSPQQIRGETPDPRDDLYALGIIAHELLAGANPFLRKQLEAVLKAQLGFIPESLSRLVPGLPEDLSRLVESLLAKDRDDRPPDAAAAREGLKAATRTLRATATLSMPPLPEPRPGSRSMAAPAPVPRPFPRGPALVALAILVAALGFVARPAGPVPARGPAPAPPEVAVPWDEPGFGPRLLAVARAIAATEAARLEDPAAWPSVLRRLPGIGAVGAWVESGALAAGSVPAGALQRLRELHAELAPLGLGEVLGPLVEPVPAQDPVALEGPRRIADLDDVLAGRWATGWLGAAARFARAAEADWAERQREFSATRPGFIPPGFPPELYESIGTTRLHGAFVEMISHKGPGTARFVLGECFRDPACRVAGARWVAKGSVQLRRALAALGYSLAREADQRETAALMAWRTMRISEVNVCGALGYLDPDLLLLGPPRDAPTAFAHAALLTFLAPLHDPDPERAAELRDRLDRAWARALELPRPADAEGAARYAAALVEAVKRRGERGGAEGSAALYVEKGVREAAAVPGLAARCAVAMARIWNDEYDPRRPFGELARRALAEAGADRAAVLGEWAAGRFAQVAGERPLDLGSDRRPDASPRRRGRAGATR